MLFHEVPITFAQYCKSNVALTLGIRVFVVVLL
jgi:hypothetical protein